MKVCDVSQGLKGMWGSTAVNPESRALPGNRPCSAPYHWVDVGHDSGSRARHLAPAQRSAPLGPHGALSTVAHVAAQPPTCRGQGRGKVVELGELTVGQVGAGREFGLH
jgi:hypothetical protein